MRATVLGPLKAWRGGTELDLGPPMRRALLAVLLTQPDRPVLMSEIVDVLWGDTAPQSAPNLVHRHVGALRKVLGTQPGRPQLPLLVRASGGYRLQLGTDQLDLLRFRALRIDAEEHRRAGDNARCVSALMDALELWRGPLVSGLPKSVRTHPMFTRVDREYPDAMKDGVDAALDAGGVHPERVLLPLHRAAAAHPLDEALHARLVTVLHRTGDTRQARQRYDDIRRRLSDELGLDPGPELAEAAEEIHRPRSESRSTGDEILEKPSALSHTAPPAQLPPDLGVFTGRQAEMALAYGLLPADGRSAQSVVISAIGGMAGVGKTALSIHWAHKVAHRYPDGQLYADLRGFDPGGATVGPEQILRSFLDALGVPPEHVPVDVDAQASLYRGLLTGKRILVVLDNARDTDQVRPLLPDAAGCLAIVTSRTFLSPLVDEGAHPVALDVLDDTDAHTFLSRRLGHERLAAQPQAVQDIIDSCAGLPLALAIVSARTAMNPQVDLAALAAELREEDNRLATLSAGDPTTDIETILSWSYQVLTPLAARVFRTLSLHPGAETTLATASSLLGLPQARVARALAELIGAHLLTERFPGRFVCHDLLRSYASELLRVHDSPADQAEAVHRLLDHLLHGAHRASAKLAPHRERLTLPAPVDGSAPAEFTDRQDAARWMETHTPLILAAVSHGPTRLHAPTRCWQLASTVELHLDRHGRWQEQLTLQTAALDAAQRSDDLRGRAHAHRALGFGHGRLGDTARAKEHLTTALELFAAASDRGGEARTHRYLAFFENKEGRHDAALAHYSVAHALYTDTGQHSGRAQVHNEVGWTHILRGDHTQALVECRQALDLHHHLDDTNGEAAAWDSLGYAHHHLGAYEKAVDCYRHALTLYRLLHDRYLEADTLVHIGDSQESAGAGIEARTSWSQALLILDELAHPDAETVRRRLSP
ncbi:BTAD domain-containing putative transcriptional regulator [Streptomyces sp. NPDC047042]|uniref:AfsR/SARP family transcriptional regulator n=1 Tax=Streptomyces sp. NPDC047042 TaxID=3154807 RepID=UPI00340E7AA0